MMTNMATGIVGIYDDPDTLRRLSVVTIMGHVDSGTHLLDAIRETSVTAGDLVALSRQYPHTGEPQE